jgi:hypothetical protein
MWQNVIVLNSHLVTSETCNDTATDLSCVVESLSESVLKSAYGPLADSTFCCSWHTSVHSIAVSRDPSVTHSKAS